MEDMTIQLAILERDIDHVKERQDRQDARQDRQDMLLDSINKRLDRILWVVSGGLGTIALISGQDNLKQFLSFMTGGA